MCTSNVSRYAAAALACLCMAGCGDGSNGRNGADGQPGASAVVRSEVEPPGPNCEAGGQKLQFGTDSNGSGQIDASEVLETRYVCNGAGAKVSVQVAPIPAGDARCASGGYGLLIDQGDGKAVESLAVCNGTGIPGPQGPQGPQGPAGGADPAPNGQFLKTQIIRDALLTCDTVELTSEHASCNLPLVNGVQLLHDMPAANGDVMVDHSMLCEAVTGKAAYAMKIILLPMREDAYGWNGKGWTFFPQLSVAYARLGSLFCSR